MTFIEVHINEDGRALEKLIGDAYMSLYQEAFPGLRFGQVIVWKGRMFQELQLLESSHAFAHEERIFHSWNLPDDRARMQVGSIQGDVFTTPPDSAGKLAARVKEGGRCGREHTVKPFHYSNFDHEVQPQRPNRFTE
jgi:hypothetical protein